MDPISIAIAGVGAGLSIFGASKGAETAKRIADLDRQKNEVNIERMRLDALTSTRDIIRESMLRRAVSVNAAANSGGGLDSSGVQGSLGQISNAAVLKTSAVDTALNFGIRTGNLNSEISSQQANQQNNQMYSSIGSSLFSNARSIGQFFKE